VIGKRALLRLPFDHFSVRSPGGGERTRVERNMPRQVANYGAVMSTYERVAELPVEIDSYALEGLSIQPSREFERLTTVIQVLSDGLAGSGEDITYEGLDAIALQDAGPVHDLSGPRTVGELCELIGSLDLFPVPPEREVSRLYRRWAFESAALDLALKQANTTLAEFLGLELKPLTFVASMGLKGADGRSDIGTLQAKLDIYPDLQFKLDPSLDWDEELIAELAVTGAVNTLDLKGQYSGTPVDIETDPGLYRRLATAFPDAWLEDPDLTEETREVLEPHMDRVTWDAPIHSVAEIEALEHKPRVINIKPSRMGGIRSTFDAYDYCDREGIGAYGGGQWELGVGREQIQYLAALFHPDNPNDTAPRGYNAAVPEPGLPTSPMAVPEVGFGIPR
jgi:L-alanine-DL-glutamate epimerase-like enolase superfamily enzyme